MAREPAVEATIGTLLRFAEGTSPTVRALYWAQLRDEEGVQVTAPANPVRGIYVDSAYLNCLLDQIPGPVIAVGHSYGGAVITNSATNANNVVGLVYVAAFAPDEGESLGEIESDSKDSVLMTALMPLQYPPDRARRRRWSLRSILKNSMRSSPPTCPPSRQP